MRHGKGGIMLLQSGPIAPSSLGLWAVTFILGGLVVGFAWLVRRHFNYAVPAYKRLFGSDEDDTQDGHLVHSDGRFDQLDSAHSELAEEVDDIHDDVRKLERRTESVLSNQQAIADQLGVDLERPRFYRGGGDDAPDPADD